MVETNPDTPILPTETPDPSAMEKAEALFRLGDFREARRIAREVLAMRASDDLRKRALDLMDRTGVDPVFIAAWALAALTAAAVILLFVL